MPATCYVLIERLFDSACWLSERCGFDLALNIERSSAIDIFSVERYPLATEPYSVLVDTNLRAVTIRKLDHRLRGVALDHVLHPVFDGKQPIHSVDANRVRTYFASCCGSM